VKRIGVIHYRVGGTDGVALEIDKWKIVLEEMGHQVYLCAGDLGTVDGTLIEEIHHHLPAAKRLYRNTFIALSDYDETAYNSEIVSQVDVIAAKLRQFIVEKNIDFLIAQNVWSVAASPALSIALARVMREFQLPAIAHNHDFYWERVDGVALTCAKALEIADKYLPPRDRLIQHVVINTLAQRELLARKGIEATVVPNVFDFESDRWLPDEYNRDFRQRIGLRDGDLFILQATRIVPRKGIELAIDFVKALDRPKRRAVLQERGLYDGRPFTEDSRIVLVLAGHAVDEVTGLYRGQLEQKAEKLGIETLFIEDLVAGRRRTTNGQKVYSFWDTYVYADFVTYPSLWEGWGNQLLEAIRARLPFMLFEYPVYINDIRDKGFQAASLGPKLQGRDNQGLAQVAQPNIGKAADQAVELLTNNQLRQQMVEQNLRIGRQNYSLESLQGYLVQLMARSQDEAPIQ
jgi:glycosyltransferase involved in cell wall biosynthesis